MTEKDRDDLRVCSDYHRAKRVEYARLSSRPSDFHDGRADFHERLRLAVERVLTETVFNGK